MAVERINYRECLTPVRAFYLDLAHWAVEDPGRWAIWVTPCPIGEEEINRKKSKRRRKSRMDARTRERLPVLPVVVRSVLDRRTATDRSWRRVDEPYPARRLAHAGTTWFAPLSNRVWSRHALGTRPRAPTAVTWPEKRISLLGMGRCRGRARHRHPS